MIKDLESTSYVLLQELKKLRDEGPVYPKWGICSNLSRLRGEFQAVFDTLARNWPQFSGDIAFPVSGAEVYMKNRRKDTLWKGEQRDLRMSLINFCIKELENEITRT